MLKNIILCLFLSVAASAMQQPCNAKADDCKKPYGKSQYYPEQHCTCATCEKDTPNEKIICTNDEREAQKLQARISGSPFETKEANAGGKGKSMNLTGWVKDQDGKTMFINDKDKQAWSIENMDAVKGHEGHRVKVKAKLNEADHSLNVEKLTMLSKSKQSGEERKKEDQKQ